MITYTIDKDPWGIVRHDVQKECWRVLMNDHDKFMVTTLALCPTENDAKRIAEALERTDTQP